MLADVKSTPSRIITQNKNNIPSTNKKSPESNEETKHIRETIEIQKEVLEDLIYDLSNLKKEVHSMKDKLKSNELTASQQEKVAKMSNGDVLIWICQVDLGYLAQTLKKHNVDGRALLGFHTNTSVFFDVLSKEFEMTLSQTASFLWELNCLCTDSRPPIKHPTNLSPRSEAVMGRFQMKLLNGEHLEHE
eukprot:c18441_g1_i1.p1 GENE.c18441_g1_i1~~c18441_g1_i1.p1  ORF type:complete len:190 (-),score=73.01 c18441_g1_i1:13-582(-)